MSGDDMQQLTEIIPAGCLSLEDLTARKGWASVHVARVLNSKAKKRREAGAVRPGDLPAPDGYATYRKRPYWRLSSIEAWEAARPSEAPYSGVPEGFKRCTECAEVKPLDDFHEEKDGRTDPPVMRRTAKCKGCRTAAAQSWNELNPERRAEQYRRARAAKYGLTEEQLDAMEAEQEGRCVICQEEPEQLVIDHCHATGKVRGLLCGMCNVGLGVFKDRPHLLAAAIAYLAAAA